jgi:flagellar hook protein FlgE
MSFESGLSGLNAASKNLDAIGNNVANANTVGFKSGMVQFADVYANSLNNSGGSKLGIGTRVAGVAKQFTQGNISTTSDPLDIAINGNGFFRMSNNGTVTYARNGEFNLDKDGYIVNVSGARLTGYAANASGSIASGSPVELHIDTTALPPQITSKLDAQLNLNSGLSAPTTTPFDPTDPDSYNNATSATVYDSLGNSHVLQTFYVRTAGGWNVYATSDDVPLLNTASPATSVIASLTFGTNGLLTSPGTGTAAIVGTNGAANFTVAIDYTSTTQYGSAFSVNSLEPDGYASGRLSGFTTGADGIVLGHYTNGKSAVLGQVVLANFANPNGLQPLGNNLWAETADSGTPLVGAPGSSNLGALQSSATEDSNVDLTAELVNMITAQRTYQANAQTIKTEDQIMQTLVNLR